MRGKVVMVFEHADDLSELVLRSRGKIDESCLKAYAPLVTFAQMHEEIERQADTQQKL